MLRLEWRRLSSSTRSRVDSARSAAALRRDSSWSSSTTADDQRLETTKRASGRRVARSQWAIEEARVELDDDLAPRLSTPIASTIVGSIVFTLRVVVVFRGLYRGHHESTIVFLSARRFDDDDSRLAIVVARARALVSFWNSACAPSARCASRRVTTCSDTRQR